MTLPLYAVKFYDDRHGWRWFLESDKETPLAVTDGMLAQFLVLCVRRHTGVEVYRFNDEGVPYTYCLQRWIDGEPGPSGTGLFSEMLGHLVATAARQVKDDEPSSARAAVTAGRALALFNPPPRPTR